MKRDKSKPLDWAIDIFGDKGLTVERRTNTEITPEEVEYSPDNPRSLTETQSARVSTFIGEIERLNKAELTNYATKILYAGNGRAQGIGAYSPNGHRKILWKIEE